MSGIKQWCNMKKIILTTVLLVMALAVTAQTYNNPRQRSTNSKVKITKVERTPKCTVIYLHYTASNNPADMSLIDPRSCLIDEATGKKYFPVAALNFKWNTWYKGNCTYKIQFPALPKYTSVVTFQEPLTEKNAFIVTNIALPVKGQ